MKNVICSPLHTSAAGKAPREAHASEWAGITGEAKERLSFRIDIVSRRDSQREEPKMLSI